MNGSKCLISTKTHRPVLGYSTGKVVIDNGKIMLFNTTANAIVQVPITDNLLQMFQLKPAEAAPAESEQSTNYDEAAEPGEGSSAVFEELNNVSEEEDGTSILVEESVTELLIAEIAKRPPLYNEKLPLVQRSKSIRKALELEIFHALGGQIALVDITKKWCYLKKEYKKHRAILYKYVRSGCSYEEAAAITGKPLWKHYKALTFIDDPLGDRETVSNVPNEDTQVIGSPESSGPFNSPGVSPVLLPLNNKKKRRAATASEVSKVDEMIINELSKPASQLDSTDHFCRMLALEMKKLEARKRAELQIKFFELLNEQLY